ncbi:hypothetical protein ABIF72_005777 [Bradyrhizobium japonicum]
MLAKERNDICVKPSVEIDAIEIRRIGADGGGLPGVLWGAGREEGKMPGIVHEMVVRLDRKPLIDRCRTASGETIGILRGVRTPQLNRHCYRFQILSSGKTNTG